MSKAKFINIHQNLNLNLNMNFIDQNKRNSRALHANSKLRLLNYGMENTRQYFKSPKFQTIFE